MYNLCCYHPHHLYQHRRRRRGRAAPVSAASPNANEVEEHHDHGLAVVNFIQQVTGASYPKTWDDLTDPEQKKILACLFEEGVHSKKVLFSTLVHLEYISKKGAPFTTTTTAVELDEWEDDWRVGELRILCLTSACTSTWTQIYSLEFVSQETGSICTLELQHDFNFRYSIPDKQFIVFDRKLKDKTKRLVFATTTNDKLVDFVECLNRALATMNDNTQRKLSGDNCAAVPTTPPYSSHPPPLSPGGAGPSGSAEGIGGHEPMTAKKIIEIIKRLFERKEKEDGQQKRTGKIKKLDISGPTDFRHVQHFGAWDARANDSGALIVNNVQDLLKVPTTPNGTTFSEGNGNQSQSPNTISPTQDKRTLSFIFDVIEESRTGPPLPRSAIRDSRQPVQLRAAPHMTDSENHSTLDTKDKSQSFAGHHDNHREKLIQDLQAHLQDEDTRQLIFEFIETYKQEIKSDDELEKEKPSSYTTGNSTKARASSPKWSSGRNSAPPPPRNTIVSATFSNTVTDVDDGSAKRQREPEEERPFNYTAVRDSLRAELQHQQTLQELQIKPGCQEKGAAALLSRANTWSNNQVKGSTGPFNTLPSPKPVLNPVKIKKVHSEVRRRPTTPPPPPLKEVRVGSNGMGDDDDARGRNGHRVTPDPEEPPVVTKKAPPPIPKPRTSKMLVRRINSNPSSETEPRYANISTSKSFNTETGVGIPPGESESALVLPARPSVPSAANTLLVAELREKIDGIKQ